VKVTDSEDPKVSVTGTLELAVDSTLKITLASLPEGMVGMYQEVPLTATGGVPPYTWTVAYSPADPDQYELGLYFFGDIPALVYLPLIPATLTITPYVEDAEPLRHAGDKVALPLKIVPAPIATETTLASSDTNVETGASVTFTATVTVHGGGIPAGPVTFFNGAAIIGSATLNAKGQAALKTSFASAGSYSITAAYGGNTSFAASTSAPLTETVVGP
jgi:hypothetical protein